MAGKGLLYDNLRVATSDLTELNVAFALVGGLAVSSHTVPRMTKDVDLCLATATDLQSEAVVRNLLHRKYKLVNAVEHVSGRLATVRVTLPESRSVDPELDLIFCTTGIEEDVVACAESISVFGIPIRIASVGHLIAMKILSESETRLTDRTLVSGRLSF